MLEIIRTIGFCERCQEERTVTPPRPLVCGPEGRDLCRLHDRQTRFEIAAKDAKKTFMNVFQAFMLKHIFIELHREMITTGHERALAVKEAIER